MALTKISRSLLDTGVSDSSDATAITINSSENVGIGTSSPSYKLHTSGSDAIQAWFQSTHADTCQIQLSTATTNSFARITNNAGTLIYESDITADNASSGHQFKVDGTERIRIDSSGNVGIGRTDPTQLLEVHKSTGGDQTVAKFSAHNYGDTGKTYIEIGGEFGDGSSRIGSFNDTGNTSVLVFETHGASSGAFDERMRIDSSGNVGINATSLSKLGVTGTGGLLQLGGTDTQVRLANSILHHDNSGNTTLHLRNNYGATSSLAQTKIESGFTTFHTGTSFTERMRINANGTVMVGTTTNPTYAHKAVFSGNANIDGVVRIEDIDTTVALSNAVLGLAFPNDSDATNGYFVYMTDGNGAIGSISVASGTSVSFNTTSDERLKKNIVNASPQLDIIKSVKVREFDWKINNHHELGLIAQEIKDIIPNVVTEGGDDETKNPYGVDYGKLTPYLIKAMQEQQTIIDDLKSRIETLES